MEDYIFIEYDRILQLNRLAAKTYGGIYGVRDQTLVESAINQPKTTFDGKYLHPNIYEMAAAYFYHISENQGFLDANQRTGFLAMFSFLKLNGYDFIITIEYLWSELMDIASKKLSKERLSQFIMQNTTQLKN